MYEQTIFQISLKFCYSLLTSKSCRKNIDSCKFLQNFSRHHGFPFNLNHFLLKVKMPFIYKDSGVGRYLVLKPQKLLISTIECINTIRISEFYLGLVCLNAILLVCSSEDSGGNNYDRLCPSSPSHSVRQWTNYAFRLSKSCSKLNKSKFPV